MSRRDEHDELLLDDDDFWLLDIADYGLKWPTTLGALRRSLRQDPGDIGHPLFWGADDGPNPFDLYGDATKVLAIHGASSEDEVLPLGADWITAVTMIVDNMMITLLFLDGHLAGTFVGDLVDAVAGFNDLKLGYESQAITLINPVDFDTKQSGTQQLLRAHIYGGGVFETCLVWRPVGAASRVNKVLAEYVEDQSEFATGLREGDFHLEDVDDVELYEAAVKRSMRAHSVGWSDPVDVYW